MTRLYCSGEGEHVDFAALSIELLAHVLGFPSVFSIQFCQQCVSNSGEGEHVNFAALPIELLAHVLGFLPPRNAVRCATVCTSMAAAMRLPEAWHGTSASLDCHLKVSIQLSR